MSAFIAIPNDVDLEMADLERAGDLIAAGICPACEDALNPLHPKWAGKVWPPTRCKDGGVRPTTAAEYAAAVGPLDETGTFHAECVADDDFRGDLW